MENEGVKKILLISPYWREEHRWMISTTKLAELWQRLGFSVVIVCMGGMEKTSIEEVSPTLKIYRKKDRVRVQRICASYHRCRTA
jgi:hypothetical protein